LISIGAYEKAETEIRIFENDFATDGPVYRYKIALLAARAAHSPGLLKQDREKILQDARALALLGIGRFPQNKTIMAAYGDVGVEFYRLTGSYAYFDEALACLRAAEDQLGDPDIARTINRLNRRLQGQPVEIVESDR
jgi:hypothetical protein